MGRRKTKKIKPSKSNLALKNRRKLDREFHCHFCQHDRSVSIKIDMRSAVGFLSCRICGVNFSTRITSLDEPIDVYTVWMDKCRETDKVLVTKEEGKNLKPPERTVKEDSYEKPVVEKTEKNVEPETEYSVDNTKVEPSQDSQSNVFNEPNEEYWHNNPEPDSSYKEPKSEEPLFDDELEDYDMEDQFVSMSRNKLSQRIIGADEMDGELESPGNPDAQVHDLFQDDD